MRLTSNGIIYAEKEQIESRMKKPCRNHVTLFPIHFFQRHRVVHINVGYSKMLKTKSFDWLRLKNYMFQHFFEWLCIQEPVVNGHFSQCNGPKSSVWSSNKGSCQNLFPEKKNWFYSCFHIFHRNFVQTFIELIFSLIALRERAQKKTYLLLSRTLNRKGSEQKLITVTGAVVGCSEPKLMATRCGEVFKNLSLHGLEGKNRSHGLQLIIIFLRIRSKSFISNNRTR